MSDDKEVEKEVEIEVVKKTRKMYSECLEMWVDSPKKRGVK